MLCLTVLWARGAAHDTAHGPFTRAVPPMGHGHFHRVVPAHGMPTCVQQNYIQTYQVQSKQQKSKFYETDYYQKELCAMLPH
jgi:hypothetical protein